jgi:hypothetical protein
MGCERQNEETEDEDENAEEGKKHHPAKMALYGNTINDVGVAGADPLVTKGLPRRTRIGRRHVLAIIEGETAAPLP